MTAPDPSHNLAAYHEDGSVTRIRIWFPDTFRVWIEDVAASATEIAAVGVTQSNAGRFAGFLAFVSRTGKVTRVVRTAPFEGHALAFGPDGSIWVLGLQTAPNRSVRQAPDHAVLHQYGPDGRLLKQLLPRSTFACGDWHPAQRRSDWPWVVSSSDRVGVLSPICQEWIELTPDGIVVRRQRFPSMPTVDDKGSHSMLMGLAMTRDNEVYASFQDADRKLLYRLVRENGTLEPVRVSEYGGHAPELFRWLLGSDGDSLVYARDAPAREIVWARVIR